MNIGMIGLGKLGLPVALAMSLKGHNVIGYDINPALMQSESYPHRELGPNDEPSLEPALRESNLVFGDLPEVVALSDIIFVSVQTPHDPRYEGITRLPDERIDFNYRYLETAVAALSAEIARQGSDKVVVIISTVLPGTIRERILPLINERVKLCYNPYFIAMGTVIRDFYYPEFILLGTHDEAAAEVVTAFYRTITEAPVYATAIENAELIKVAYNTYISTKIAYVNTLMEICHKLPGTDIDQVTGALALANRRLISPAYMRGGMGDGGGCHPRDNIALSWLAKKLDLSFDWFEAIMLAREEQTDWLADLALKYAVPRKLPIVVMGFAFKPETNLTTGSPAVLLAGLIDEVYRKVYLYDPYVTGGEPPLETPAVFFIGCKHEVFSTYQFPEGSVVIDPHRYIPDQPGVQVIRVGAA